MTMLQEQLSMSFNLVFIAFAAMAFYLLLERDRVPEEYRTTMRVSATYIAIAAVAYYYMKGIYADGLARGETSFPTEFRYIDWLLTTPLMLLKFPLMLGVGERGVKFMSRLVVLDLAMVIFGYGGEIATGNAAHWGLFIAGCAAWVGIAVQLFLALIQLPEHITEATSKGVRVMGVFVVAGWAIYPLGFFAPLLGLPVEARELTYNVADFVNKLGLCLVVYIAAKRSALEIDEVAEEEIDVEDADMPIARAA